MKNVKVCPLCGSTVDSDSNFCEYCGYSLKESTSETGKTDEPVQFDEEEAAPQFDKPDRPALHDRGTGIQPEKKYNGILIAAGVVIAATVIAVCIFVMGNHGKTGQDMLEDKNPVFTGEAENGSESSFYEEGMTADSYESSDISAVEEKILDIRNQYNQIMAGYDSGIYSTYAINAETISCWDGSELVMISAGRDDSYDMDRSFYYADGELIFAYYEADCSYRFYFDNGELIRVRYCRNASDTLNAVNYDDPADWGEWPGNLKMHSSMFVQEAAQVKKYMDVSSGDSILPNSSTTYLSMSDLNGLTKEECRIARNEIFARHGRMFDDETLQAYFKQFEWYEPTIAPENFTDNLLNDYELKNLDLIIAYEKEKGYR
ncbi:MAG: YARHG domain-containing protein [Lachnospiraceae bacterium]|nr:YARHG domain-containing protein [Lachnospiraceae bacterium]